MLLKSTFNVSDTLLNKEARSVVCIQRAMKDEMYGVFVTMSA